MARLKTLTLLACSKEVEAIQMTERSENNQNFQGKPKLGASRADRLAAVARAGAGLVPIVGSALTEIVNELAPNQRLDRVEKYIILLQNEVTKLSEAKNIDNIDSKMKEPESIALLESGARLSARFITDERRVHVSRLVAEGIIGADSDKLITERFLSIYGELDDGDLALLIAWSKPMGAIWKLNPSMNSDISHKEKGIAQVLFDASNDKLERLRLLTFMASRDHETGLPQHSRFTGRPEGHRTLSEFGRLMLARFGMSDDPQGAIDSPSAAAAPINLFGND